MDFITIHGQKVLVDIVYHDSMEEPESACTNRLISIKTAGKTYHRLGTDPRDVGGLIRRVGADLSNSRTKPPKMLTVMVTSFAKEFVIDWPASVSAMTKAELLGLQQIGYNNVSNIRKHKADCLTEKDLSWKFLLKTLCYGSG